MKYFSLILNLIKNIFENSHINDLWICNEYYSSYIRFMNMQWILFLLYLIYEYAMNTIPPIFDLWICNEYFSTIIRFMDMDMHWILFLLYSIYGYALNTIPPIFDLWICIEYYFSYIRFIKICNEYFSTIIRFMNMQWILFLLYSIYEYAINTIPPIFDLLICNEYYSSYIRFMDIHWMIGLNTLYKSELTFLLN